MCTLKFKTISILVIMFLSIPSNVQADNLASTSAGDSNAAIRIAAVSAVDIERKSNGWTKSLETGLSNRGTPKNLIVEPSFGLKLMPTTDIQSEEENKRSKRRNKRAAARASIKGLAVFFLLKY